MRVKYIISSMSIALGLAVQVSAFGAGLGKITVNSALGQPLSADIAILVPDATELKNLHASLGSRQAYQQAGVDMSAILEKIQFTIKNQPDGTAVLHLSSTDPVQDPFLDVLVDLEWGNGQIERDYTLLLDPPSMQHAVAQVPQVPPVANVSTSSVDETQPVVAGSPSVHAPHRHIHAVQASGAKPSGAPSVGAKSVKVRSGMTLSGIAGQYKPEGVQLDQMLVGLYRENPQAFDGNMNRMRSGQILHIPDRETLTAIGEAAAVREVHLQAEDWHAYRQKLAGEVERSATPVAKNQQVGGKIAPAVQDHSAAAPSNEGVLKLSKGASPKQGQTGAAASSAEKKQMAQDDAAAKKKALEEAKARTALLEKNAQDMQRLLALKNQQAAMQHSATAPAQNMAVVPPNPVPVQPPVATPKPPVPHLPHKVFKPAPVPVAPQPAWYESINPMFAAAVGGVVVLLGLLVLVINSRKRRAGLSKFENSILTSVESKPNTVYNTQSGASVNTSNTSFLTDFSQSGLGTLDTHDVDPIAEAEVYMAYGRDVQAEEILKEAMQKEPQRHEIKVKLLEIYAGRNNLPAFEAIATDLYSALAGQESPLWDKAAEMGRKLDPRNPLYGGVGSGTEPVAEMPVEVESPVVESPVVESPAIEPMLSLDEAPLVQHPVEVPDEPVSLSGQGTDVTHSVDDAEGVWDVSADGDNLSGALDFDFGLSDEKKTTEPSVEAMPDIADHEEFSLPEWNVVPAVEAEHTELNEVLAPVETEVQMPVVAHEMESEMTPTMEALPEVGFDSGMGSDVGEIHEHESAAQDTHAMPSPSMDMGQEGLPEELSFDGASELSAHDQSAHDQPVMLDFSGIDLDLGDKPVQSEPVTTPVTEQAATEPQGQQDSTMPAAQEKLSSAEQEVKTKLELAQVYHEMGDAENAREILQEVLEEGNEIQRAEAQALMQTISNA